MLQRSFTTAGIILAMIPIIRFSDTWLLPVLSAICCLIGMYEMLGCIGLKNNPLVAVPIYIIALSFPLCVRLFPTMPSAVITYAAIFFALLMYLFALAVFENKSFGIEAAATAFATTVYITVAFTATVLIRDIPYGIYIFPLVFLGPWTSDVFAYLTGRFFGKHKLIPEISPKKTVEGAVGGIIFTVIAYAVFGFAVGHFLNKSLVAEYFWLALSGAIVSVVSQIGDLIFSAIKRRYGIKNFGYIFPGHGGMLDRFDSVIAVVPIVLILCVMPHLFELYSGGFALLSGVQASLLH